MVTYAGTPMQRLLMGEVGSGKAQPLDAHVLTPTGFRRMGEIRVGDEVVNPTGEITPVTGVFPQGRRDVYRVWFSDETHVDCDLEHLWQVQTSTARWRGDKPKVMSLGEIAGDLRRPSGAAKWHVELPEPIDLECGLSRPLDPYALGLLLGDGGLSLPHRVRFTTSDPELVDALRALLPEYELRQETHRPYDWKILRSPVRAPDSVLSDVKLDNPSTLVRAYRAGATHEAIAERLPVSASTVRLRLIDAGAVARPSSRRHRLLGQLGALGLMGKRSHEKFVPRAYLAAPIRDRHALLQGLMDTDGTVGRSGLNVSFTSASRQPRRTLLGSSGPWEGVRGVEKFIRSRVPHGSRA